MIRALSGSPKVGLAKWPGMTPQVIEKVLAFRAEKYEFTSVSQIKEVTGLSEAQFEELKKAFMMDDFKTERTGGPEEVGEPAAPLKKDQPAASAGSKKANIGGPGPGSQGAPGELNLSVRAHFYSSLPGYDLSGLTDPQRMAFLETVNRELCSCGCVNETLGYCLVNDPGCPVVKARVKKLYKDMIGSDPVPPKEEPKP